MHALSYSWFFKPKPPFSVKNKDRSAAGMEAWGHKTYSFYFFLSAALKEIIKIYLRA